MEMEAGQIYLLGKKRKRNYNFAKLSIVLLFPSDPWSGSHLQLLHFLIPQAGFVTTYIWQLKWPKELGGKAGARVSPKRRSRFLKYLTCKTAYLFCSRLSHWGGQHLPGKQLFCIFALGAIRSFSYTWCRDAAKMPTLCSCRVAVGSLLCGCVLTFHHPHPQFLAA